MKKLLNRLLREYARNDAVARLLREYARNDTVARLLGEYDKNLDQRIGFCSNARFGTIILRFHPAEAPANPQKPRNDRPELLNYSIDNFKLITNF